MTTTILCLAIIAIIAIALEEFIHLNKAKSTLFLGSLSWLLLFFHANQTGTVESVEEALNENLLDIATLWLFLVATMTFVAYLNARGLISGLVVRALPGNTTVRKLTVFVTVFSLLLSMLCDNITATLVSISVIQSFSLTVAQRVRLCVLAVFAVNSGGVLLITGDVTTLMIFNAGHVSISELFSLIVPALSGVLVLLVVMLLHSNQDIEATQEPEPIRKLDMAVGLIFFTTIVSTMLLSAFYFIPPMLTFIAGLSVLFMVGGIAHRFDQEVHFMEYTRKIQFDALFFFLGILLIVGALKEVGVLEWLTKLYGMMNPDISNALMGVMSSLLDNVPLTAALLKAEPVLETQQWLSLVYAVGVGGSILVIGSAAGIVAMSRVKELTFMSYLRFAPHLVVAYFVGYATTLLV